MPENLLKMLKVITALEKQARTDQVRTRTMKIIHMTGFARVIPPQELSGAWRVKRLTRMNLIVVII
jgi:hypothetical protein